MDNPPENIVRYYAGVDWGYDHYGSIVIIGETDEGVAYIVDGWAERYKHIDWWIQRAEEFIAQYGNIKFYCDTARTETYSQTLSEIIIKAEFANNVSYGWH